MCVFTSFPTYRIVISVNFDSISPADDEDFFWGLEDSKTDTPVYLFGDHWLVRWVLTQPQVELKNGPATLRQNLWQFHHHSGPPVVDNIIDDLQLTLDWMDTTFVRLFSFRTVSFMNGYQNPSTFQMSYFRDPTKTGSTSRCFHILSQTSTYTLEKVDPWPRLLESHLWGISGWWKCTQCPYNTHLRWWHASKFPNLSLMVHPTLKTDCLASSGQC